MRRPVVRNPAVSRGFDARSLFASVAAAATLAAGAAVAGAQAADTVFDWGDNDKTVDSGKAHINFTGPAHAGDIIVSFGDRKLYYITGPGEADTYPIAIPRDQSRWEGVTTVSQKRENPSWTPTAHMMAENPRLPRWVPGGHPMNPLGIRAMYLGSSDYRIHGTDAPWTIGTAASKGCVRMFNKDVVDLYPRVKIGSKVTVTWQKFDSKTLAMAEHAKAVSDPDPDHGHAGKVEAASFSDDDASETPARQHKAKVHKTAAVEPEAAATASEEKAAVIEPSDTNSDRPARKSASAGDGAASSEPAKEPSAKVPSQSDDDKAERKPRRSAKRAPHVETGSLQSGDVSDEASAMAVAKRAVAAAEKAAQAAERAAAAAERAAAATQEHAASGASDPSPGVVRSY